jgi:hypothetical protein
MIKKSGIILIIICVFIIIISFFLYFFLKLHLFLPILLSIMSIITILTVIFYSDKITSISDQIIGLLGLSLLLTIIYAWFTNDSQLKYIGFFGIIPLAIIAVITILSQKIRGKKSILAFVNRNRLSIQPKMDIIIAQKFYTFLGNMIPFENASNIIKISSLFYIFRNKYVTHIYAPYGKHNHNSVQENQLCFLLDITPVKGRHQFILKSPVSSMQKNIPPFNKMNGLSQYSIKDDRFEKAYEARTNNPNELTSLISVFSPYLINIYNLMSLTHFTPIDQYTTNLDIQISDNYLLLRTNIEYEKDVEEIYENLLSLQKAIRGLRGS